MLQAILKDSGDDNYAGRPAGWWCIQFRSGRHSASKCNCPSRSLSDSQQDKPAAPLSGLLEWDEAEPISRLKPGRGDPTAALILIWRSAGGGSVRQSPWGQPSDSHLSLTQPQASRSGRAGGTDPSAGSQRLELRRRDECRVGKDAAVMRLA